MTEQERQNAEQLALEFYEAGGCHKDAFEFGYAAACEAKRNESAALIRQIKLRDTAQDAERARSAKLISVLKTVDKADRATLGCGNNFLREIIAEYEASRD